MNGHQRPTRSTTNLAIAALMAALPFLWGDAALADEVAAPPLLLFADASVGSAHAEPGYFRQRLAPAHTWITTHVHIKKGKGFEYNRPLKMGKRDLVLGVQGPVMRKSKLGVTFELRF